jgi:hypothetical protein
MNIRLQNYKKNRMKGMGEYNAAIAAKYSKNYAKGHCSEIEERAKIGDMLDRQGLTDKALTEKHSQLLNAKKVIGYLHQYKKVENGGIEKISPDEIISNEFLDTDDFAIQFKALELAYKLKDHLKDKALVDQSQHHTLILQIGKADDQKIRTAREAVGSI